MHSGPTFEALVTEIDRQRRAAGFLAVGQILELAADNTVLDPLGLLISVGAEVGTGNVFYPGVVVETRSGGTIRIGNRNTFYPQSLVLADAGRIAIGSGNELGPGGLTLHSSAGAEITVGDGGRYNQGAQIGAGARLGGGSQVLGAIAVIDSVLEAGASYRHSDPDQRGGVLKGSGTASGIVVRQGEVINRRVMFEQAAVERQTAYHPKPS